LANIRVIADEIRRRQKEDDDVLGALQLTFDKTRLREIFPRRIEALASAQEPRRKTYVFNADYISHLTSVMTLSSDALNDFLRAAGSQRTFSYGSSKYYDGQTFEEVLYREWPAQTIALSLEKRLLDRIATAHRAISVFMTNADVIPGRGMPRPASPAFTDNSAYTLRVAGTMLGKDTPILSPKQEDASWAHDLEDEALDSFQRVSDWTSNKQPEASMSYEPVDKGKGKAVDATQTDSAAGPSKQSKPALEDESKGGNVADDEEQGSTRQPRSSRRASSRAPSERPPASRHESAARSRGSNAPSQPAPPSHHSSSSSSSSSPSSHRAVEVLYHSFFLLDYCYIMTKTPAVSHIFTL